MDTLIDYKLKKILNDKNAREELFQKLLTNREKSFDVEVDKKSKYRITIEDYLDHKE